MPRIRTIKPEFFCHEELFDLEAETKLPLRIAFAGLWTICDREGRFKWRPRSIKSQVLPYDDVDFSRVLDALATRGFVVKYTSEGVDYGHVPGFGRHQVVNNREAASALPKPPEIPKKTGDLHVGHASGTRDPRDDHAGAGERKGKEGEGEGKGKEVISTEPGNPASVPVVDGPPPVPPTPPASPFDPSSCRFPVFPCSGDVKTWQATSDQLVAWQEAYPGIDANAEHRKAHAWIMANLTKRKTATGYSKYLNSWMARVQDSLGRGSPAAPQQKTFAQMKQENTEAAFMRVFGDDATETGPVVEGIVRRISSRGDG